MPEHRSGTRAAARGFVVAAALLLAVTGCQTTTLDPSAEALRDALEEGVELANSSFKPDDSLRVRYLPPVGSGQPKGDFMEHQEVEVLVFELACAQTGQACEPLQEKLSTRDGGDALTRSGDTYTLRWPVLDPSVAEQVRVEIRMTSDDDAPLCSRGEPECLGYLDVRVVQKGGKGHGGGSSKGLITVPSGGTFEVRFKVLSPTSPEQLAVLSGQGALDLDAGSCPANELSLPSQGLQAVGAGLQAVGAGLQAVGAGLQAVGAGTGGLFVVEEEAGDIGRVGLDAYAAPLLFTGLPKRDVLLIVLDDFGDAKQPTDYLLPPSLAFGDLGDLENEDLLRLATDGEYSHGGLVFFEVVQVLQRARGLGVFGYEPRLGGAPYVQFGGHAWTPRLRVQAVNGRKDGTFDTDTAAAALADALATAKARGFKHVVVNMSFSIVPCGVLDDFASVTSDPNGAVGDLSGIDEGFGFEDYVAALMAYNSVPSALQAELERAVRSPVSVVDDALLAAIGCPPAGGTGCGDGLDSIVFVAASGNYGLDFPMFPAALQGVVSVGAQAVGTDEDPQALLPHPFRAGFSNAAAVLAPGDVIVIRRQGTVGLALKGTSFATPIASAFSALDLQTPAPRCEPALPGGPTADGGRAELAVGGFDPLTGTFAGLPGLPLLKAYAAGGPYAVKQLCGSL